MTGRGQGWCRGAQTGVDFWPGPGFAGGYGRGRWGRAAAGRGGRGYRHGYWATGLPGWMRSGPGPLGGQAAAGQSEWEILRRQAELLREQLADIEARLNDGGPPEEEDEPR